MKAMRFSGPVPHPVHGEPVWYISFYNIDHIAFRKWTEETGARYKFTREINRVMLFDETDAMLCWITFR